jgi:hypothetical protein
MRSSVDVLVNKFLGAWNGSGAGLDRLLDPAFTLLPAGVGRSAVLSDATKRGRLEKATIADVATVGDVLTVDLVCDWDVVDRDGKSFRLPAWPVVLQIRIAAQPKVLRVMPRAGADRGVCGPDAYVHEGLRARLQNVQGTRLRRAHEAPAELQIALTTSALPDARVEIVGHFAEPDAQAHLVRFRLSQGASVLRRGAVLSAEHSDGDGWTAMDWRFDDVTHGCSREMWRLATRGRRHFLVRHVVTAATPEEAEKRFVADPVQKWFASVSSALTIE